VQNLRHGRPEFTSTSRNITFRQKHNLLHLGHQGPGRAHALSAYSDMLSFLSQSSRERH
jgi:hypothetical protein